MGLLDVLNGMRMAGGQRSASVQSACPRSRWRSGAACLQGHQALGGNLGGTQQPAPGGTSPRLPGNNSMTTATQGGGPGDILGGFSVAEPVRRRRAWRSAQGRLGGLLAGGAAGSVLSGGLGGLLKQFQQNGQAKWSTRGSAPVPTETSRKATWRSRSASTTSTRCPGTPDCRATICCRACGVNCPARSTN